MKNYSIFAFDLIGFASFVEKPTLPRVLAPVLQNRDSPSMILLPPLRLVGDEIFEATESDREEFAALILQRRLTALEESFAGKSNYDLWVNPKGVIAYEPKATVKVAFKRIFDEHIRDAQEQLVAQDYAAALRAAAIARAVNPSHLDPLVIRAVAERMLHQRAEADFTRHLASNYISVREFDQIVNDRVARELVEVKGHPMQMMTIRKSKLVLTF